MNMKKKLRQAFKNATPDVLEVLPDMDAAPSKPMKKKMSDRTKEFISTAASIALLIGVGGGMIVYLAGGGNIPGTTPTLGSQVPTGPFGTGPTTSEFEWQLMTAAMEMVKPGSSADMDATAAPTKDGILISVSYKGVIYNYYYDTYGTLQRIEIPNPNGHEITQSVAAQIAHLQYRDFIKQQGGILALTACERHDITTPAYRVELLYSQENFGASSFMVYVDAYSGQILEQYGKPEMTIDPMMARELALMELDASIDDPASLQIDLGEYDGKNCYVVNVQQDDQLYWFYIDGITGDILRRESMNSPLEDDPNHIGWVAARDICLAKQGIELSDLLRFSWSVGPSLEGEYYYTVHFNNDPNLAGPGYIMAVRATDGAVLTVGGNITQTPLSDGELQNIVFDYLHLPGDVLSGIMAGTTGSIEFRLQYRNSQLFYLVSVDAVSCIYTLEVDAYSGEILSCTEVQRGMLTESDAIELALNAVNVRQDQAADITCVMPSNFYYVVTFTSQDTQYTVMVHIYTGEILELSEVPITDSIRLWLTRINPLFSNWRTHYSQALLCTFDDPKELDLKTLFYRGFEGESQEPTDEEWALLKDKPGFEEGFDLMRLPRKKMNDVLVEVFGVSLDYIADTGFAGLVYLEETDCYYHQVSDVEALTGFNAVSVEIQEDGTICVRYTADSLDGIHTVILMPSVGGAFTILSNN